MRDGTAVICAIEFIKNVILEESSSSLDEDSMGCQISHQCRQLYKKNADLIAFNSLLKKMPNSSIRGRRCENVALIECNISIENQKHH